MWAGYRRTIKDSAGNTDFGVDNCKDVAIAHPEGR